MDSIKKLRLEKKLTQKQVADLLGISIRSYKSYENDPAKEGTIKYRYILERLNEINPIDEEHGILDMSYITDKCSEVFEKYPVKYCILFGSYAKNGAQAGSDVDLLISTGIKGLKYYGMVENLRTALHKKVDVLGIEQLENNLELVEEILKYGIRIYG